MFKWIVKDNLLLLSENHILSSSSSASDCWLTFCVVSLGFFLNIERRKKKKNPTTFAPYIYIYIFVFFCNFSVSERIIKESVDERQKNIFKQGKRCCYSKNTSDSFNSICHCLMFPGTVDFLVDLWAVFPNRGAAQGLSGRGHALIVAHLKGTLQALSLQKGQSWTSKQQPCLPLKRWAQLSQSLVSAYELFHHCVANHTT